MPTPFRIFISSPVRGYELFREEILRCANQLRESGKFEFFFYEEHANETEDDKSISQVIFEKSGILFDAMFVSFAGRIGPGTWDELRFFNDVIKNRKPDAKLWWCQAFCPPEPAEVSAFKNELALSHGIELPMFNGTMLLRNEKQLTDRFAAHLMRFLRD